LTRAFSLGSVNRGDFWVQRRPLLAYFDQGRRPCSFMTMRVVKDDYDFASAQLFSTQQDGYVVGLVNFRTPGGDHHPTLDPVENGQLEVRRLFLEWYFDHLAMDAQFFRSSNGLLVQSSGIRFALNIRTAVFGSFESRFAITPLEFALKVELDLLPEGPARKIRWADVGQAAVSFTLAASDAAAPRREYEHTVASWPWHESHEPGGLSHLEWITPAGALGLDASTHVLSAEEHGKLFKETINGKPVPQVRLSEERLGA